MDGTTYAMAAGADSAQAVDLQAELEAWEAANTPDPCPLCGGDLQHFGTLGRLDWLACRHCGAQFSRPNHRPEGV